MPYIKHNPQAEQFYRTISKKENYPIGTLAYYGPDDQTVTKITAGILLSPEVDPILKQWMGNGIASDPAIVTEIGSFFQKNGVGDIVMTNGIIGCPHVAGEDYPLGEACPLCPYWQEKQ